MLTALRAEMRARRRALAKPERQRRAQRLAAALIAALDDNDRFRRGRRIAGYCPFDGEADPAPALAEAQRRGLRCFLPTLDAEPGLRFVRWETGEALIPNRYGIPEPRGGAESLCLSPSALDIVLLPLVAFDAAGNRLGMGGGFYDRALADALRQKPTARPLLIGVAHAFQQVERLHPAPWDIPLDGAATEQGTLFFAR